MRKGDIVLVSFPFTDIASSKLRPALIIASTETVVTAIFITTNLEWKDATDIPIIPDENNGIKRPSLLRVSKIMTLDRKLVKGILGMAGEQSMQDVNIALKRYLQLY
jgi:mRNA interferase MazF